MNPSIEETIDRVEQLFTTLTGHPPPHPNGDARIPPEIEPGRHVEDQLGKLLAAVEERLAPDATQRSVWMPRVVAWRDDSALALAIDVPGVSRGDVELRLDGHVLIVRGSRRPPWGEARHPEACEAPLGTFARTFALAERVDASRISARLEAGVLRVRIATRAMAEPSPISIQS